MAEAWLRRLGGRWFEAHSAGTQPRARIHPLTTRVMEEVGVDTSYHWAKSVDLYAGERFDHVITVCDQANEACPIFPGSHERLHWSLPDPAAVGGTPQERLEAFRQSREEIRRRVVEFVATHTED